MTTEAYPNGQAAPGEPKTLIVCHNSQHRRYVADAFKIKARYALFGDALVGAHFDTLIVFRPHTYTVAQERAAAEYIECVQLRLARDGRYFII